MSLAAVASPLVPPVGKLTDLPWVQVAPDAPYFVTETGAAWTPIGQNDAITWVDLQGLFRRQDLAAVDRYLALNAAHGVTVLRLMLEYSQVNRGFFERPAGKFQPALIHVWDDLLAMCANHGLRVLLTPYDTFFMWVRWQHHPYNAANGGPCRDRSRLLLCQETRKLIKDRLSFMTDRWGGTGVIFAWDLWNEIHPAYAGDSADCFFDYISDLSEHMSAAEERRHGRRHLQTVSMFGPHIPLHDCIADAIYRHPLLDFASTHLYEEGSIDHPKNTVDAAINFGRLVGECVAETPNGRPYFDSEHGPIHTFKDRHKTLPAAFDDEYFRHMQWAHLASGGAGGGMRWPNRHPHSLTPGMREAQRALAGFLPLIDWAHFDRRNLSRELQVDRSEVAKFACGDERQAVVYLLRTDVTGKRGRLLEGAKAVPMTVRVPGLAPGHYCVTVWDPTQGCDRDVFTITEGDAVTIEVQHDVVLAIQSMA